jgi:hypothetical protein
MPHAAKFSDELVAIFRDLKEKEMSGRRYDGMNRDRLARCRRLMMR